MKSKFKLGQLVKHPEYGRGKIASVVRRHCSAEGSYFEYGIKFNKKHEDLHTLDGNTPNGYGWYCLEEHFTLDPISYLKEIDDKIKENSKCLH